MAKKKQEEKEEVYYVGIKDPIEIRRSLLESSKEIVQYLQRAERFKATRTEKAEQIARLKAIMHEITSLVRKVKTALPKTKIRARMHKHEEKVLKEELIEKEMEISKEKGKIITPEEKPKAMSEIEKLESELGEIESRLTKMD